MSALAGPVGLGIRAWRTWAGSAGRPAAVSDAPAAALDAWVGAAFDAAQPVDAAARWASAAGGCEPDRLLRMTRYDLDVLWRGLPVEPRSPVASAAFLLLSDRAAGAATTPARLVRELAGPADEFGRAVAGLYGPDRAPALLLTPAPGAERAAVRLLEAVAASVPAVPVGVALDRAAYDRFVSAGAATRAAALLREGFVEVRGVGGNELEARLRAAGVEPPAATVARLAADGVADDVAVAFVSAARAVRDPGPAELASDFRSVHEEFLFGQLESLPATAGLFRPNQPLPFRHGPQAGEADLLAAGLKLAVEVDGGFFHLNPDQYRRDRRKDYLYQRHGYLVLRFLAEDVVTDLERILDTILEAVAARRGLAPPTGAA